MKLPSPKQLLLETNRTFARFPLVIAVAAVGTVAAIILIDNNAHSQTSILFNVLFGAVLGIPLLTGLALIAEKRRASKGVSLGLQFTGILLLAIYAATLPSSLGGVPTIHFLRLLLFAVALHLFVAFVPFAGVNEVNGFWHYNKTLFLRICTAALFAAVLFGGLALALAAVDHLFGINVPPERYGELWVLVTGMFMTSFFLGGIPERLEELNSSTEYPKAIRVFAQYILLPLVFIYLIILYLYAGKILIAWDWPQGWVSKLIFGFSVSGIFSLLLLHPIREQAEHVWVRTIARWFYVLMLPLIVMLILALWRRTSEYGITEGRYIGVVLALWLAAIAIYFTLGRKKNIRVIPASLCAIALLISVGPWGMFHISEQSQLARLHTLLAKHAILVNETVQKAPASIPVADRIQINSIIYYLCDVHGCDGIQPWFKESLPKDTTGIRSAYSDAQAIEKILGTSDDNLWITPIEGRLILSSEQRGSIDITGYDRLVRSFSVFAGGTGVSQQVSNTNEASCRYNDTTGILTFILLRDHLETDSVHIELHPAMERLFAEYGTSNVSNVPNEKMFLADSSESLRVKIHLFHMEITQREKQLRLGSITGEVLYGHRAGI